MNAFKHYRPQEVIGAGGQAEVWLGIDERDGTRVAMKRYQEPAALLREADALRRISSHRIARYLDSDGSLILVREFVEGPTLLDVLRRGGAIDRPAVMAEVREASLAVRLAGVESADLYPCNLVLSSRGVVLIDVTSTPQRAWPAAMSEQRWAVYFDMLEALIARPRPEHQL